MDENHTDHPDKLIDELDELSGGDTLISSEYVGTRRSYTKHREIVRRDDGSVWALEYNANEDHSYATAAYEVVPREKTVIEWVAGSLSEPPADLVFRGEFGLRGDVYRVFWRHGGHPCGWQHPPITGSIGDLRLLAYQGCNELALKGSMGGDDSGFKAEALRRESAAVSEGVDAPAGWRFGGVQRVEVLEPGRDYTIADIWDQPTSETSSDAEPR